MLASLPLRVKILIATLCGMVFVVGTITFAMAQLFHSDKSVYIRDLSTLAALHAAEESRSLILSYRGQLSHFSRLMLDEELSAEKKSKMIKNLFVDFPEVVSVSLYRTQNEPPITIFDDYVLKSAGISQDDVEKYRKSNPLPFELLRMNGILVENSTITESLPLMAVSIISEYDNESVISAQIRLDSLLKIAGRQGVFETFILDRDFAFIVHSDISNVSAHKVVDWIPGLNNLKTENSAATAISYELDGKLFVVGFSPVDLGQLLVGVQIPESAAYLAERDFLTNLMLVSLALLLVAGGVSVVWARRITQPLERLSTAAESLANGDYSVSVDEKSSDEFGKLATSFNVMTRKLEERHNALNGENQNLIKETKAKDTFLATMSHELRTPLNAIIGYSELIREDLTSQDVEMLKSDVDKIRSSGNFLLAIINNILDLSKISAGKYELNEMETSVEGLFGDVRSILSPQALEKGIDIVFVSNAVPPSFIVDVQALKQVLINVVSNAVKFSEKGEVYVESRFEPENNMLKFVVIDSGVGITKEYLENIFEPFTQADESYSRKYGGTGLGLTIAKKLCQMLGGDIFVESVQGSGTRVTITAAIKLIKHEKMLEANV